MPQEKPAWKTALSTVHSGKASHGLEGLRLASFRVRSIAQPIHWPEPHTLLSSGPPNHGSSDLAPSGFSAHPALTRPGLSQARYLSPQCPTIHPRALCSRIEGQVRPLEAQSPVLCPALTLCSTSQPIGPELSLLSTVLLIV